MKVQISQRRKEYLEKAQTLVRAVQTMTDRAIATQLKALVDDIGRGVKGSRSRKRIRNFRPERLSQGLHPPRSTEA